MAFDLILAYDMPDAEYTKRDIQRMHRAGGKRAMEWFVGERLQKRFDGSLRAQLRFEKRDEWYNKLKREIGRPVVDHRWRGRSKRAAQSPRLTSTPRRLRIAITGLSPGYGRFRSPTKPNLQAELKRTTPEEATIVARKYAAGWRDEWVEVTKRMARKRGKFSSADSGA